jgi:hypothetical protein
MKQDNIKSLANKLGILKPDAIELKEYSQWLRSGTQYSNQDIDISQALLSAIWRINNNTGSTE